jgi:Ala-tRNA(Pro) deacylase
MFYISELTNTAPAVYRTENQKKVYQALRELNIPYERVDTDAAVEMEACLAIDRKLGVPIVKTLFLCNRQQTQFYLFITCGDKPFSSKAFSAALGISRVSFAPAEKLEQIMGSRIGGTSVLGALFESSRGVQIVFDSDTVKNEWFGCSDSTAYAFLKLRTDDLLHKILPYAKHGNQIISMETGGV